MRLCALALCVPLAALLPHSIAHASSDDSSSNANANTANAATTPSSTNTSTPANDAGEGSLLKLVDDVAAALEKRAQLEKIAGAVKLEVTPSRGIDSAKVERGFLQRLKRRLASGGTLSPTADAALRCRITLSEEGGLVWATAILEGTGLPGPSAVAISRPIDRELELSLGATLKSTQTRFAIERLGVVPAGVLDAMLVDIDGDGADELVVLGVDGVRIFRPGASRLERVGNVVKLPDDRRWPRVPAGWLARLEGNKLWAVTSAGHSIVVDTKTLKTEAGLADLVPLRNAPGPLGPLCGSGHIGSPVVSLPLVTLTHELVRTPGLPSKVRDVGVVQGGYVVVDADGQLLGFHSGEPATLLAPEHVGDRIVITDLDGDGEPEIITTSASPPGEPDHLVVRRLDTKLSQTSELYRSALSGGTIAALAAGRVDFGSRADVVVIEEIGKEAVAWRLRYTQ